MTLRLAAAARRPLLLLCLVLAAAAPTIAQSGGAPPGYYASVDTTGPTELRATLHATIDDHTRFPYTAGSTDTWDILEAASEDPSNPSRILDVYRNESFAKQGGGNSFYNREHSWPKSYGFPDDAAGNYPYTDCHLLMLCDDGYNSARSNKPFRYAQPSDSEYSTVFNNGQGGGSGGYPGNSNWTNGSFTDGTWEVWIGKRGDVARAMLYADVRYEGGNHGVTGFAEPDLVLTDSEFLIDSSNTGNNESVAYMGMISVLLQWHAEDPVDDWERDRNDVVFAYQGNRNPFVDHPEWVDCLWGGACSTLGVASCFGSGCPCGNDDPTAGCANSTGLGGLLGAGGTGSVAADDLALLATQLPSFHTGLFYMGDAVVSGLFFDGIQCALGNTLRFLASAQSSGPFGEMSYTGLVAASGGMITSGSTWHFHAWHRDTAGPCGTGSNLTNMYSVTFVP